MPTYFKARIRPATDTRQTKIQTVNIDNRKRAMVSWDHGLNSIQDHFPLADFLFAEGDWHYFVGRQNGQS